MIRGIGGRPYIGLDEHIDIEGFRNLHPEICRGFALAREYAKEGTGGNVARMILFWPAWAQTLHNADKAILAANDRNHHLIILIFHLQSIFHKPFFLFD